MRLNTSLKLMLVISMCLISSGCWNSVQIEEQVYATAIAVDYVDEEYIIYAQGHNFTSLLELNRAAGSSKASTFIGIGKGKSMYEAALTLARSAQTKVDWGQAKGIIVTDRAFEHDNISILRHFYRFPDTRANCWFFITQSPIESLLSTGNIFDDASLNTILMSPMESYNQEANILPLYAFQVVANYNEPDRTIAIPVISIDKEHWQTNQDSIPLIDVREGYFVNLKGEKKIYAVNDIPGYSYTQKPARNRITLKIDSPEDEVSAELVIVTTKKKINVGIEDNRPKFELSLKYQSALYELHDDIDFNTLHDELKKKIEEDIYLTFTQGVSDNIDILNLMPAFRQSYPQIWRELTNNGQEFILNEQSLDKINIMVSIPLFGKYKLVPDSNQYLQ